MTHEPQNTPQDEWEWRTSRSTVRSRWSFLCAYLANSATGWLPKLRHEASVCLPLCGKPLPNTWNSPKPVELATTGRCLVLTFPFSFTPAEASKVAPQEALGH